MLENESEEEQGSIAEVREEQETRVPRPPKTPVGADFAPPPPPPPEKRTEIPRPPKTPAGAHFAPPPPPPAAEKENQEIAAPPPSPPEKKTQIPLPSKTSAGVDFAPPHQPPAEKKVSPGKLFPDDEEDEVTKKAKSLVFKARRLFKNGTPQAARILLKKSMALCKTPEGLELEQQMNGNRVSRSRSIVNERPPDSSPPKEHSGDEKGDPLPPPPGIAKDPQPKMLPPGISVDGAVSSDGVEEKGNESSSKVVVERRDDESSSKVVVKQRGDELSSDVIEQNGSDFSVLKRIIMHQDAYIASLEAMKGVPATARAGFEAEKNATESAAVAEISTVAEENPNEIESNGAENDPTETDSTADFGFSSFTPDPVPVSYYHPVPPPRYPPPEFRAETPPQMLRKGASPTPLGRSPMRPEWDQPPYRSPVAPSTPPPSQETANKVPNGLSSELEKRNALPTHDFPTDWTRLRRFFRLERAVESIDGGKDDDEMETTLRCSDDLTSAVLDVQVAKILQRRRARMGFLSHVGNAKEEMDDASEPERRDDDFPERERVDVAAKTMLQEDPIAVFGDTDIRVEIARLKSLAAAALGESTSPKRYMCSVSSNGGPFSEYADHLIWLRGWDIMIQSHDRKLASSLRDVDEICISPVTIGSRQSFALFLATADAKVCVASDRRDDIVRLASSVACVSGASF